MDGEYHARCSSLASARDSALLCRADGTPSMGTRPDDAVEASVGGTSICLSRMDQMDFV